MKKKDTNCKIKPYDPKHSPYGTEKVKIEIKNTKTHKLRYKHTRNKAQPGWWKKESRETQKAPKHRASCCADINALIVVHALQICYGF